MLHDFFSSPLIITPRPGRAIDSYGLGCIIHDLAHCKTSQGGDTGGADLTTGVVVRLRSMDQGLAQIFKRALASVRLRITHSPLSSLCSPARFPTERSFEPCISADVPPSLAALLRAVLAVAPQARPTAEAARVALANLASEALAWSTGGAPAPAAWRPVGGSLALVAFDVEGVEPACETELAVFDSVRARCI